jgi:folate-dependent phosphoribosylglycinamide formyltransferase PurN
MAAKASSTTGDAAGRWTASASNALVAVRPHGERLRVGVLLGERPDLLGALRDVAEIEIVAVARDRAPEEAAPPPGMAPELFGWWPERGPGARERREAAIAGWFEARDVGLVVAAGWLWILTPAFLSVFGDRVVNVHPTLLPAFPGRHSVERAVAHGVRLHGVTVHRVDEGVDTGPILSQAALRVDDEPNAREVRRRLAPLECRLLAGVVRGIAVEEGARSQG